MKSKVWAITLFCLSQILPFCSFSQINQWTWVQGDSTDNNVMVSQVMGSPSPANTPGGRRIMATWKDNAGNLYLYGGLCSGQNYGQFFTGSDLWKYDPSINEWAKIQSIGAAPVFKAGSAYWTDNTGNFWLFGGPGNDLWKYMVSTNAWTQISGSVSASNGHYGVLNLPSAANIPGGRYDAVSWADNSGNLWLYGGLGLGASGSQQGFLNDLWKYNITTNKWTWVNGDSTINHAGSYGTINIPSASNNPGGRHRACSWIDDDGNFWLFGGIKSDGSLWGGNVVNDLWKYDIFLNEWVWKKGDPPGPPSWPTYGTQGVFGPGTSPGSTVSPSACKDLDGNFWLFGGVALDPDANVFANLNTLWKYDPLINEWAFMKSNPVFWDSATYGIKGVADPANKPGSRGQTAFWVDNIGNLWIYGGGGLPPGASSTAQYLLKNDLWKFTLVLPVPVKLITFTGRLQDENVLLNWTIENEINLDRYEIERSLNGTGFEKITQVKALNQNRYNAVDVVSEFEGRTIYYRLKMVDIDGKFTYSNIIKFHIPINTKLSLYPNPANSFTKLKFNENINSNILVKISDATGRIVLENNYRLENGAVFISTVKFAEGTYPVTVVYEGRRFIQDLVIIR